MTFEQMEEYEVYAVRDYTNRRNPIEYMMKFQNEETQQWELSAIASDKNVLYLQSKEANDLLKRVEIKKFTFPVVKKILEETRQKREERKAKEKELLLPEDMNRRIASMIKQSNPSDHIYITKKQRADMASLWIKDWNEKRVVVPPDILFAGTLPMRDCIITEKYSENSEQSFRVVIASDYKENLKAAQNGKSVVVGAILLYPEIGDGFIFSAIWANEKESWLDGRMGYTTERTKYQALHLTDESKNSIFPLAHAIWYSVEIALLHPAIKELFKNPTVELQKEPQKKKQGKNKRKIVKYVKRHVIDDGELERAIYGEHKEKQQHTFVWYVIGHWRELKSGRKVFVNPYWKGPLRELKRNLDERQREIVMPEV